MDSLWMGKWLRRAGGETAALVLLVPLVLILGVLLVRWPVAPTVPAAPSLSPVPVITTAPTESPTPSASPTASSQVQDTVTLDLRGPAGRTAFPVVITGQPSVAEVVLKAAAEKKLQVTTKDYGGTLGLFIDEINGVKSDAATGYYWHLYVNGQLSPLGASSTTVKVGDTISWRYEHMHNEQAD